MLNSFVEQPFVPRETPDALSRLHALALRYMTSEEINLIIQAFHLAREAFQKSENSAAAPLLFRALDVASILADLMHVDAVGVAAGLVFEAVDADALSLNQVEEVLGASTARVVGSMLRLNILERRKQEVSAAGSRRSLEEDAGSSSSAESKKPRIREALRRQQAETVRKMFVAMAEDPRVVLLKLAYRLQAMRQMCQPTFKGDPQEMITMAQETREIYAPLAGRLGMSRIESELEDQAFQILEPDKFVWVRDLVELESKQWRSYVERVCTILRAEMAAIGVKAEVSGRVKHLYSFYKKLARTAGDVDDLEALKAAADINQIHDLIAFRILVTSTPDCYTALGHVHSLWKPKEGRIKDFIANPKPNGYSALHTTVFCLDDHLVEVQIRTHSMHEMAEYGVAMHWHYKDVGDNASASARELLTWLRQLSEWQHELRASDASDTEFVEAVKGDIFQEQIFVFTPKGEVKDLPVGSTPLDFAYRIHTKIGDSCAGARIITEAGSGETARLMTRMVPLDYELKSGEIVDIITSRSAHPTRDWLSFARTAAAKSKIRRYLKLHERDINIQIGRERLERELKMVTGRVLDAVSEDLENYLSDEYHLESFDDILAAVGADDVRPRAVVQRMIEYWQLREGKEGRENKDEEETVKLPAVSSVKPTTEARLKVAGVSGLLTRLANCCCPLPGDPIVGFVSRGKGVIVHRTDCRNIAGFRQREHERLIHVSWQGMSPMSYMAPIVITGRDRVGLTRDIVSTIADAGISLISIHSNVSGKGTVVVTTATLELDDLEQMYRLFTRLEKIKGVMHVARDLGGHR
ncbi:RelA/SpoT family protein [Ktedonosporobacter rubrisoli]|nr:RelA/SpoT family protein [Ktedonosporobacter rubrisoli]